MCHRLNTLYDHLDKIPAYKEALAPVYTIMDYIRKSTINIAELARVQTAKAVRVRRPVYGAATRWTYDSRVIRRAKKLHPDVNDMAVESMYFKDQSKKRDYQAKLREWNTHSCYYIEFLLPVMERIEFWTVFMESGSTVTLSIVLYCIDDLHFFIECMIETLGEYETQIPASVHATLASILPSIQDELKVVFTGFNDTLLIQVAEVLDFRVAAANEKRRGRREVVNNQHPSGWEVHKLMQFYDNHHIANRLFHEDNGDDVDEAALEPPVPNPTSNPFARARNTMGAPVHANDPFVSKRLAFEKECESYVSKYLWEDFEKVGNEHDRLQRDPLTNQWPNIQEEFPMLALIAASVFEAPASIAGSERFFSRLTHIISPTRSSLQKDFAGKIVLYSMKARRAMLGPARKRLQIPIFGKVDTSTMLLEDLEADEDDVDGDDVIDNEDDSVEEGVDGEELYEVAEGFDIENEYDNVDDNAAIQASVSAQTSVARSSSSSHTRGSKRVRSNT